MTTIAGVLGSFIGRWRFVILAAFVVFAAVASAGLSRLEFDTQQDTLVPAGSKLFRDNVRYQDTFGGGELVVLLEGPVTGLYEGENLKRVERLHEAVAANPRFFRTVSPDTILRAAETEAVSRSRNALTEAAAVQGRAADEARRKAVADGKSELEATAAAVAAGTKALIDYIREQAASAGDLLSVGALERTNPRFVRAVFFSEGDTVRPELKALIPDANHSLFVATLKGNMSVQEQSAAVNELRKLVADAGFTGQTSVVTGETVLLESISASLEDSIPQLTIISVVLMVAVVLTVFRARWRLLHLPVVALALATAMGIVGWLDLPFTLASTAGLPILIGLSVDFGIQFHTRYEEEFDATGDALASLKRSLATIGPALLVALIAACLGFAALLYSTVPMVRDFSIILSLGIAVVFVVCLFVINAVLFHRDREGRTPVAEPISRMERVLDAQFRAIRGRALPILAIAVLVAAAGFVADGRLAFESEPEQFIPPDGQALKDVTRLRDLTSTGNVLSFLIEADDVTTEPVLRFIDELGRSQLAADGRLTAADSLASLIRTAAMGKEPDFGRRSVDATISGAPADIIKGAVSPDRKSASMTFRLSRTVKLADQEPIIERIETVAPPSGVTVAPAGLGVIGVDAESRLTSRRTSMTVIAIVAAFLLLLLVTRNVVHAFLAMLPVVLVTGWTSAAMWVFGVPLNPLTAISGPLVVALGTEFTILLLLRYREERGHGRSPGEAMALAYRLSGRAITASGLTVVGAFVALAFDSFPLLSDFGIVAVLGVVLSLAGAMLLMPPLLVWSDELLARRGSPIETPV